MTIADIVDTAIHIVDRLSLLSATVIWGYLGYRGIWKWGKDCTQQIEEMSKRLDEIDADRDFYRAKTWQAVDVLTAVIKEKSDAGK